ncbi:MAG: hypothetical protein EBZ77_11265 [Chitinophagia bacterium]|nr:hypothetical protein [Chitinophagia bacterium]
MYQFRITQQESGGFRFEYNGIKILVDDYFIKDGKHFLKSPDKAIAYFDIENNIYGISNEPMHFASAEDFHDAMVSQFKALK